MRVHGRRVTLPVGLGQGQHLADRVDQQAVELAAFLDDVRGFLARWLPEARRDNRSYITVAIGCIGGQHRSVYLSEQLYRRFDGQATTLVTGTVLDPNGILNPGKLDL